MDRKGAGVAEVGAGGFKRAGAEAGAEGEEGKEEGGLLQHLLIRVTEMKTLDLIKQTDFHPAGRGETLNI